MGVQESKTMIERNPMQVKTEIKIKSPLRWAGGKAWLTKDIKNYLPECFNNYYEPFLGGGAITLYLAERELLNNEIFLSDCNPKLIEFYQILKERPSALISKLKRFENTREYYYDERKKSYSDPVDRAAQFLFLNKTSFNGIYRENLQGVYNVPYGNKKYRELFDFKLIKQVSFLLRKAKFNTQSFTEIKDSVGEKDLVFLDPPYTVAHENNGFVKYNQKIFSWEDQIELKNLVMYIASRGAYFILTNAYHSSILDLYSGIGNKHILNRISVVGGKNAMRTTYKELLISNVK